MSDSIDKYVMPFNFQKWIEEHRHLLKPPVGNKQVFEQDEFIIMVVGGPNQRKDYHYNEGAEFFYQLEGNMNLRVFEKGEPKDIHIREGEIFLLPPKLPHSPQREANSIGLVVERKRLPHEDDALMWFCDNCHHKLYHESFHLQNIETDMPPVFNRFFSSEENRTCSKCGTVMDKPKPKK